MASSTPDAWLADVRPGTPSRVLELPPGLFAARITVVPALGTTHWWRVAQRVEAPARVLAEEDGGGPAVQASPVGAGTKVRCRSHERSLATGTRCVGTLASGAALQRRPGAPRVEVVRDDYDDASGGVCRGPFWAGRFPRGERAAYYFR